MSLSLKYGTMLMVASDPSAPDPLRVFAKTKLGEDVTDQVPPHVLRRAWDSGLFIKFEQATDQDGRWKLITQEQFFQAKTPGDAPGSTAIQDYLSKCTSTKPGSFKIPDLKWRFAVRSVLRGENLYVRGPHGTGKTSLAVTLAEVLERPFERFNLGSTQDPRSSLIGNTHFKKDEGTFVAEALFVKAIQTPNMVILLDEITRAHPEAGNILMSVLDKKQRYLRIDEQPGTPTIKVAAGVTFIATGNVGAEYTTTRVMDRALLDRFSVLVLEPLSKDDEILLLTESFPDVDASILKSIAIIADDTRKQIKSDNSRISSIISTRQTMEMAALAQDGFTLGEIAEMLIYPFYSDAGGPQSEQTYMKSLVQMQIKAASPIFNASPAFPNSSPPQIPLDPNNGALTPWSAIGGGV